MAVGASVRRLTWGGHCFVRENFFVVQSSAKWCDLVELFQVKKLACNRKVRLLILRFNGYKSLFFKSAEGT